MEMEHTTELWLGDEINQVLESILEEVCRDELNTNTSQPFYSEILCVDHFVPSHNTETAEIGEDCTLDFDFEDAITACSETPDSPSPHDGSNVLLKINQSDSDSLLMEAEKYCITAAPTVLLLGSTRAEPPAAATIVVSSPTPSKVLQSNSTPSKVENTSLAWEASNYRTPITATASASSTFYSFRTAKTSPADSSVLCGYDDCSIPVDAAMLSFTSHSEEGCDIMNELTDKFSTLHAHSPNPRITSSSDDVFTYVGEVSSEVRNDPESEIIYGGDHYYSSESDRHISDAVVDVEEKLTVVDTASFTTGVEPATMGCDNNLPTGATDLSHPESVTFSESLGNGVKDCNNSPDCESTQLIQYSVHADAANEDDFYSADEEENAAFVESDRASIPADGVDGQAVNEIQVVVDQQSESVSPFDSPISEENDEFVESDRASTPADDVDIQADIQATNEIKVIVDQQPESVTPFDSPISGTTFSPSSATTHSYRGSPDYSDEPGMLDDSLLSSIPNEVNETLLASGALSDYASPHLQTTLYDQDAPSDAIDIPSEPGNTANGYCEAEDDLPESNPFRDALEQLRAEFRAEFDARHRLHMQRMAVPVAQLKEARDIVAGQDRVIATLNKTITGYIAILEEINGGNVPGEGGAVAEVIAQRDEVKGDLAGMENAFADLHSRYESLRAASNQLAADNASRDERISLLNERLETVDRRCERLQECAESTLHSANNEIGRLEQARETDTLGLRAQVKKCELQMTSLKQEFEQKSKESVELSTICDELILKVSK